MYLELNNYRLHFQTHGNRNNPAILLSHTLATDLSIWDPLVAALEADYFIIRYDIAGHGKSSVPDTDFTITDLAHDAVRLLNHLNISKAHYIGISLGSMIGQAIAINWQDRISSLTLLASTSKIPDEQKSAWSDRINLVQQNGMSSIADATMERWFTASAFETLPDAIKMVKKLILQTNVVGYAMSCAAIQDLNFTDQLKAISCPCLILVGAQDEGTPPSMSRNIESQIEGAEFHIIDGAAHQLATQKSKEVNAIISGFLKRI